MNFKTDIGISLIYILEASIGIGIGLLFIGMTISVLVWTYRSNPNHLPLAKFIIFQMNIITNQNCANLDQGQRPDVDQRRTLK
jgi:hypothetical protein